MEGSQDQVLVNEFRLFYGIDRELYSILVRDLCRDPFECLQIMGFWLWLEHGGFCNIIGMILSLAPFLIDELADEALRYLSVITNQFPFSSGSEIPLTRSLLNTDLSLPSFYENRGSTYHNIQGLISDVYIPVLSDIMETARHGGFGERSPLTPRQATNPSSHESLVGKFSNMSIERDLGRAGRGNENARDARTMFATFSKGYRVTEREVWEFFTRMLGNCIDRIHMQSVSVNEQALYAKIVFLGSHFLSIILNGERIAKFSVNGKHVWVRQFVPRNERMVLSCGCPAVGPSACPHNQNQEM